MMEAHEEGAVLRIAVVADVHLDTSFTWAGPALGRRLRQAVRTALGRAVEHAAGVGVDAFLVAGDLFEDDHYAPDTPALLRSLFEKLVPIPVLLAPGNHDFLGPTSPYRTVEWSPNVHLFSEPRLSPLRLRDGLTLWGAAHDRPAGTRGFFDNGFAVDGGGLHVALFHGAERGGLAFQDEGKELHAAFDEEQVRRAGLAHAFVGHYHRPRDGAFHTYPGNLERLSFGEDGDRGLLLATIGEDGSVSRRREVVGDVAMHDLTVDATGCQNTDEVRERLLGQVALLPLSGAVRVARLTVVGEVPTSLDLRPSDLVESPHGLDALVVRRMQLHERHNLEQLVEQPTVAGAFARLLQGAEDLDEEERELVLRAGLRALAGRDDPEVV